MRTWTHPDRAADHRLTRSGPWDDEPDKVQWVDDATGLDCLAVRNHMGNWCGYVGVPPGHPDHGRDHDGLDEVIQVHGGLTFASSCDEDAEEGHGICHIPEPNRPEDVWWFGFDCGHAFDLIPGFIELHERMGHEVLAMPRGYEETYKPLAYVQGECALLARQLAGRGH